MATSNSIKRIRIGVVGVGNWASAKGNKMGVVTTEDLLGAFTVEAASRDYCALEDFAQKSGGDRELPFQKRLGASDARLNHVKVRQSIGVQALGEIAERGLRVTVGNFLPTYRLARCARRHVRRS